MGIEVCCKQKQTRIKQAAGIKKEKRQKRKRPAYNIADKITGIVLLYHIASMGNGKCFNLYDIGYKKLKKCNFTKTKLGKIRKLH